MDIITRFLFDNFFWSNLKMSPSVFDIKSEDSTRKYIQSKMLQTEGLTDRAIKQLVLTRIRNNYSYRIYTGYTHPDAVTYGLPEMWYHKGIAGYYSGGSVSAFNEFATGGLNKRVEVSAVLQWYNDFQSGIDNNARGMIYPDFRAIRCELPNSIKVSEVPDLLDRVRSRLNKG